MRSQAAAVALLSACLGSCSPADPEQDGIDVFLGGDFAEAVRYYEEALTGTVPGTREFVDVAAYRCEALAYVDVETCKDEFLALVEAAGCPIRVTDISLVTSALVDAREFEIATTVLEAGLERLPSDRKLPRMLERVVEWRERDRQRNPLDGLVLGPNCFNY